MPLVITCHIYQSHVFLQLTVFVFIAEILLQTQRLIGRFGIGIQLAVAHTGSMMRSY